MPLDTAAVHLAGHNAASVSILLFVDGDKELPNEAQQRSFAVVTRALQEKTGLTVTDPSVLVLHRDANRRSLCPGRLITRDALVAWARRE
jgi:hypothetical protein